MLSEVEGDVAQTTEARRHSAPSIPRLILHFVSILLFLVSIVLCCLVVFLIVL